MSNGVFGNFFKGYRVHSEEILVEFSENLLLKLLKKIQQEIKNVIIFSGIMLALV